MSELTNVSACYIEQNNHDSIMCLTEDSAAILFKEKGKIKYKGIELFLRPKNMSEILNNNYDFYIFDYGSINELEGEARTSFLTKDLKIVVSGNAKWEIANLINSFIILGEDPNTYLMFNFVKDEEKENFRQELGEFWKERSIFSEYIPEAFEVGNRYFFETILKPYLLNTNIEDRKRKKAWPFKKN